MISLSEKQIERSGGIILGKSAGPSNQALIAIASYSCRTFLSMFLCTHKPKPQLSLSLAKVYILGIHYLSL